MRICVRGVRGGLCFVVVVGRWICRFGGCCLDRGCGRKLRRDLMYVLDNCR